MAVAPDGCVVYAVAYRTNSIIAYARDTDITSSNFGMLTELDVETDSTILKAPRSVAVRPTARTSTWAICPGRPTTRSS